MVFKSPSRKNWLRGLANSSHELNSLVDIMKSEEERLRIVGEFKDNPFQKDSLGNFKFGVFPPSISTNFRTPDYSLSMPENLLDIFENDFEGLKEYFELESKDSFLSFDIANGVPVEELIPIQHNGETFIPGEYSGPRFFLYPDTNIEINLAARKFFNSPSLGVAFSYDLLTIVNFEKQKGGLNKKFGSILPDDLLKGEQSLEKRCAFRGDQQESMKLLFDTIAEVFDEEISLIYSFSDIHSNLVPNQVAELVKKSQKGVKDYVSHQDYTTWVSKLVEKYRSGNFHNYVADKILTSTVFGFNLVDSFNKGIVISNDSDIDVNFEIFYNEILPRYMAKTTIKTIQSKPGSISIASESELYHASKKQISWAKNDDSTDNIALGVLYVPNQDKFFVRESSSAVREYFRGLENYRHGKSNLINEMAKTGESPEVIVRNLMGLK